MRKIAIACGLILAAVIAPLGLATLSGQTERPAADDMKALVAEVRALRVAVERTASTNGRAQLLLGRLQLQENRLATLGRQVLELRTRVQDAQAAQAASEGRLEATRHLASTTQDANERRAMEEQAGGLKVEVAQLKARTLQLQQDETGAQQALTTEQQRWSEFNAQLEELERALGRPAAPIR